MSERREQEGRGNGHNILAHPSLARPGEEKPGDLSRCPRRARQEEKGPAGQHWLVPRIGSFPVERVPGEWLRVVDGAVC